MDKPTYTLPEPVVVFHPDSGDMHLKHEVNFSPRPVDLFSADQLMAAHAAGLAQGRSEAALAGPLYSTRQDAKRWRNLKVIASNWCTCLCLGSLFAFAIFGLVYSLMQWFKQMPA
jgi:hypothetical protein